jgi:hypothetical protein
VFTEPTLEFAGGARHVDPRFGIAEYGPADLQSASAPRQIRVGLVGEEADNHAAREWLQLCASPIERKESRTTDRPGLFPAFPGFNADAGFRAELVFDARLERPIRQRDLVRLDALSGRERVDAAVDLYLDELEALVQAGRPDVVICQVPTPLLETDSPEPPDRRDVVDRETAESNRAAAFHDVLKARAMPLRVPLQLIRPSTYDSRRAGAQKRKSWKRKQREDDATVAWNFLTALYYKAGGTPWRMPRASTDLETCYVGIAFFHTPDGKETATSVAQVYNQRGDGVIVRGGPAHRSNDDRQLHLSELDAHEVLKQAIGAYRDEHRHAPAQIVVHKTSAFDLGETDGMLQAATEMGIDVCELLWVTNPSIRLFRNGYHPPLRGTFFQTAHKDAILYTRGSVEWYSAYPGMYVPRPIALRGAVLERSIRDVAEEVLALTKMNWNSTRFDGRVPVTLRTARQVADIIKHLPSDAYLEPTYAYYM